MDLKNFTSAVTQLAEEKDISKKKIVEIIEQAVAAAYKKEYGEKGQIIKAKLDSKTGEVSFWQVKIIVDESMLLSEDEEELKDFSQEEGEDKKVRFNPERHVL